MSSRIESKVRSSWVEQNYVILGLVKLDPLGLRTFNQNHKTLNYFQLARTFLKYLNKIKETGYDLTRIHFIGHSLGAHVLGKIGEMLKDDNIYVSRITGLDPAGKLNCIIYFEENKLRFPFLGPTFNMETVIKIFLLTFKIPSNPGLRKGNAR